MMRLRRYAALGALAPLLIAAGCGSTARLDQPAAALGQEHHSPPDSTARIDSVEFRQDMRKLWEDHITWTRLFIVSAIAGLPDVGPSPSNGGCGTPTRGRSPTSLPQPTRRGAGTNCGR
jgi:hypothetical protein